LASQTVGSPGITVTPDAPICVGACNQLEGGFVFSGTSAVSLAPGGVGSFKLGDMTFTAYAGLWNGDSSRPVTCADASNSSSWAIFRKRNLVGQRLLMSEHPVMHLPRVSRSRWLSSLRQLQLSGGHPFLLYPSSWWLLT